MSEETQQSLIPFAIYCEDDNSLTFYADEVIPNKGDIYASKSQPQKIINGIFGNIKIGLKPVTDVFVGFDTAHYKVADEVPWKGYREDIKSVIFDDSFSDIKPISTAYWFCGMKNLEDATLGEGGKALNWWNTSNIVDMSHMFEGCSKIQALYLFNFNAASVKDMSYMFAGCKSCDLLELPQGKLNPDTNLQNMFARCRNLLDLNVAHFDISSVKNASVMFNDFDNCEFVYSLPSFLSVYVDDFYCDEEKNDYIKAFVAADMPLNLWETPEIKKIVHKNYSGDLEFSRKYADTIEFYRLAEDN